MRLVNSISKGKRRVYDIEVDEVHNFYANGLNVHNCATDGGVSVIKDDGTVVDITNSNASYTNAKKVIFNSLGGVTMSIGGNDQWIYVFDALASSDNVITYNGGTASVLNPISYFTHTNNWSSDFRSAYNKLWYNNETTGLVDGVRAISRQGVQLYDVTSSTEPLHAFINTDFNTGYQVGNSKAVLLADVDTTNAVATELNPTLDFSTHTPDAGQTVIVANGTALDIIDTDGTNRWARSTTQTLISGQQYVVTLTGSGTGMGVAIYLGGGQFGTGYVWNGSWYFRASYTGNTTIDILRYSGHTGTGTITGLSVKLVESDRSSFAKGLDINGTITKTAVATGADLVAYSGFSASNYLEQPYNSDLDFGTGDFSIMGWLLSSNTSDREYILERNSSGGGATKIAVVREYTGKFQLHVGGDMIDTSSASYTSGNYHFAMIRRSGVGYIYINGVLDGSGSMADSVTDTDATTTVGIDWAKSASGWYSRDPIALLRVSATAPTASQILEIYNAEKPLFQENAKATLNGTSDAVQCLAYDDSTELLHVGTSGGRSTFQGLRRVDETATNTTEISAQGGMIIEETA